MKKKELVNKVGKLSSKECLQLFKIIRSNKIKYTENQNGCYVNIGTLQGSVLEEIKQFVDICLEVQAKDQMREQQIREFSEEFETYSTKPVYQEYPHQDNDFLSAIKKDKNLNSLEKSIMKENLKHSMAERPEPMQRKSQTPRYSGVRARLLKNCRTYNRSIVTGFSQPSPESSKVCQKEVINNKTSDENRVDEDRRQDDNDMNHDEMDIDVVSIDEDDASLPDENDENEDEDDDNEDTETK